MHQVEAFQAVVGAWSLYVYALCRVGADQMGEVVLS